METKERSKIGKKSRAQGNLFEKKVRADLESKGWIVDKWTNQIEFNEKVDTSGDEWGMYKGVPVNIQEDKYVTSSTARLVPAKPKFVYNPGLKRRVMVGNSSGFPDFIAYKIANFECMLQNTKFPVIIGVESKMTGVLDKEEKEKCAWLLKNKIFSKILIASKVKSGRRVLVEYKEFKQ